MSSPSCDGTNLYMRQPEGSINTLRVGIYEVRLHNQWYNSVINKGYSFLILFILFVNALEYNERDRLNISEIFFMVYALGFSLEKLAAMQEHGIQGIFTTKSPFWYINLIAFSVYFKGTWVSEDDSTHHLALITRQERF
jgi:hypothetical protein